MWLLWIATIHFHFISTSGQFNFHAWQYRIPYQQQQIAQEPIFLPYYHRSYPPISVPIYGFNSNSYPISFSLSAQPSFPLGTLTTPRLKNLPFQSTWSSPLLANQKEYVGYVAEIKKNDDVVNSISPPITTMKNHYNMSLYVKPNLPDFLRGTTDEIQKNFYKIISNPEESFHQKQTKLDQLILNLDSKNQELYYQYRRMKELEEREKRERVHAIIASMSNKAQAVFAKLSAVLMNPTMKDMDRMDKINDFYKNVDEDVKNEFKDRIYSLN
uniref:DUF148 domain-containing protein n=1 Tax=Elaeophora elaphi TaxID=1147741 RepID=A0A0R3RMZ8_9BILA